jgi:hypothetical protein
MSDGPKPVTLLRLPETPPGRDWSWLTRACWVSGLVFLSLGLGYAIRLAIVLGRVYFSSELGGGVGPCGNYVQSFMVRLVILIFPPTMLLAASRRAVEAAAVCLALMAASLLGWLRGNSPGYELFYLGSVLVAGAVQILVQYSFGFRPSRPAGWRVVVRFAAGALAVGTVANLAWTSGHGAIFQEFARDQADALKSCLEQGRPPIQDYLTVSPPRDQLSAGLAACFGGEDHPRPHGLEWNFRQSDLRIEGTLVFHYHGREYSYPLKIER